MGYIFFVYQGIGIKRALLEHVKFSGSGNRLGMVADPQFSI